MFVVVFFLLYLILSSITIIKFRLMKERYLSKTSIGFFLLLIPMVYSVVYQIDYTNSAVEYELKSLEGDCDQKVLDKSSLIYKFEKFYDSANHMFCSEDCLCTGDSDVPGLNSMLPINYIDPQDGSYKVQQCRKYSDKFSAEEQEQFAPLFSLMEEEYRCSGMCQKNSNYVFSNIKNGIPSHSCRKYVVRHLKDNADSFTSGLVALLVLMLLAGAVMSLLCGLKCRV